MPRPSPFHTRTSELCTSLFWKDWAGHHAVRSYDTHLDREYYAIRHAAGLLDVSPLYKYEVSGPDAAAFLAALTVRDIRRLKPGRVTYLCWCDDEGKVVDDGTISHLEPGRFRVTAAEPAGAWMQRHAGPFQVRIEDSTDRLGALALQGPRSRAILQACVDENLDDLRFFRVIRTRLGETGVWISRTGYTGDLGYEVWVERPEALRVYDVVTEAGRDHRMLPAGLDALDVTRVEAGFLMNGVDYFSAHHCLIDSRKSSPYELGLGWTVQLDREPFLGQSALRAERERGSRWAFVGLVYDWDELEAQFAEVDLPPQLPYGAWRTPLPVYEAGGAQVGQATSGAWSPTLKKNLALASLHAEHAAVGTRLEIENTVEFRRLRVGVTVTKTPFFDPERKRA
ncbi:MAG: aminomethyltransferase family protein [Acidobacteriota bacterium]